MGSGTLAANVACASAVRKMTPFCTGWRECGKGCYLLSTRQAQESIIKVIKVDVLCKSGSMTACGFGLRDTKELFAIKKRRSLSEAVLIPGWILWENTRVAPSKSDAFLSTLLRYFSCEPKMYVLECCKGWRSQNYFSGMSQDFSCTLQIDWECRRVGRNDGTPP
jgi:hypothetical protein